MSNSSQKESITEMARNGILLIPNLIKLLYRLVADKRVEASEKAILLGTVGYMLYPLDFLPDIIPLLGQVDDLLLAALVLKRLLNGVDRYILLSHWDGPEDLLLAIDRILEFTRYLLPDGVYYKVVKKASNDTIDADYEFK